ncbi:MAG: hypothetical protein M3355_09635 [Actinomycetota bacterium]|nr:hypothetical protein [Actinomycetota bacterium]
MEASQPDDPLASPRRRAPSPERRRRPPPPREPAGDLLKRRLIALGIGIVVLVLLLLAVRGCLDARKERAYEKYLSDLESLVSTSSQLSAQFFERFRDPGDATELEFQAQLGASRGTSEDVFKRVEGLDTPDELSDAQADLELAFELRRDGVTSVVEETEAALGDQGAQEALNQIAADMRQFLASDVLYSRAKAEIEQVLDDEQLPGEVPESNFLPEPIDLWLDRLEIARLLAQVAGETGAAGDATRGTEISSVVLRPGTVLTPDTLNTLSRVPTEVEVAVLNGGTTKEADVQVSYEILGSTEPVLGETPIARINPGSEASAVLPVAGEIPEGDELTLIVTVFPVAGETIVDNNELAFQVVFGG